MFSTRQKFTLLMTMLLVLLFVDTAGMGHAHPAVAAGLTVVRQQDDEVPPAEFVRDEGGVRQVVGGIRFQLDDPQRPANPVIALVDAGLLVTGRNDAWVAEEGQVLGRLLPALSTAVFSYTVALPLAPTGLTFDIGSAPVKAGDAAAADDPAGEATDDAARRSQGVQVFQLMVGDALLGGPYLDLLEQQSPLTSSRRDAATGALTDGTLLIYATDDGMIFPSAFGEDGVLFTPDDPLATLPAGYTLVTLNGDGLQFDRSATATMDIFPTAPVTAIDLSQESIAESFAQLLEELAQRYPYTAEQEIDWSTLGTNLADAVAAADADEDYAAYYTALTELARAVHDVQVTTQLSPRSDPAVVNAFAQRQQQQQGTVGAGVAQLEDGRLIVTDIAPGSPAAAAGLVFGSELLQVNGLPVAEAVAAVESLTPSGTADGRRWLQVQELLRFTPGQEVTLEFRLPDSADSQTATLTAGLFPVRRPFSVAGNPMPADFRFLNGFGYLALPSFARSPAALAVFDAFLTQANQRKAEGVVLDLRGNPGGNEEMMGSLAGYFFTADNPLQLTQLALERFDPVTGDFAPLPITAAPLYAPDKRAAYTGPLAVLTDSGCLGACEQFALLLQSTGRAVIVSQTSTAGGVSETGEFLLPGGIRFTFPARREGWAERDEPMIHGHGVQPDVLVPVSREAEEARLTGNDPLIQAALEYLALQQLTAAPVTFDYAGVTSVGPAGWRYDAESNQLARADGTALTVIPQRGNDIGAVVSEFAQNLETDLTLQETLDMGDRSWEIYAGSLFGRAVRVAGTVVEEDTFLTVFFISNPDEAEELQASVLNPFLANFTVTR